MNEIINDIKPKMQKSIDSLMHEFNKIRTGRANPNILDTVKIDYYGNPTPISQAAVSYTHLTLPTNREV